MPLFGRLGRTLFACFGKGGTVDRERSPPEPQPKQVSADDEETAILVSAAPEAVPDPEHNVATTEQKVPHDVSKHLATEKQSSESENLSALNENELAAREFKIGEAGTEYQLQQDSESSNVNREEPEIVETPVSKDEFTAPLEQNVAFGAGQLQEVRFTSPTNGHPVSVPDDIAPGEEEQRTQFESSASSQEVLPLKRQSSESSKSSQEETDNLATAIPEAVVEPEQSTSNQNETTTDGSLSYATAAQEDLAAGEEETEQEPSTNAQPHEDHEQKTPVLMHTSPEPVLIVEQSATNGMHQPPEETILHKNPDQPAVVEQPPEEFFKSTEDKQLSEPTEEQFSETTEEVQSSPQQDDKSNHQEANFEETTTPKSAAEVKEVSVITTIHELSNDFFACVQREAVVVQSVESSDNTIIGYVYVRNDAYEKLVTVRYTVDGWDSHQEIEAEWITSTDAHKSDKFRFVITSLVPPYKISFSAHYEVLGQQYWDNNNHKNYKVVHGYNV